MFYYGSDFLFPAYTKNALIVDFDIVVVFQNITDTSVSHVWMFIMDLLHFFSYSFIKNIIFIIHSIFPFVVRSSGDMAKYTQTVYRIIRMFLNKLFYCDIDIQMPCSLQSHLLSTASSFFKKSISICCCLA